VGRELEVMVDRMEGEDAIARTQVRVRLRRRVRVRVRVRLP